MRTMIPISAWIRKQRTNGPKTTGNVAAAGRMTGGYATKRTTKLTTVKISKKYGRAICANFTATSYAEARPYACRGSHLRNEGRRRTAAPFNADYLRIK